MIQQRSSKKKKSPKIGVVVPAFRVRNHILEVLTQIGPEVAIICVVDDMCPEKSGEYVRSVSRDRRVSVIFHHENQGVGGATKSGFKFLLKQECDVIVKLDGDGQMDPSLIPQLVAPILNEEADYCKGNRFATFSGLRRMPKVRLIGNVFLSFASKASSGYWNTFDPNNGFVAISSPVLRAIDLNAVSQRYFFESDMLFQLGLIRARVQDIPTPTKYGEEKSSLSIFKAALEFPLKHLRNFTKRIFLNYFVRDFSLPSFQLLFGSLLSIGAIIFGVYHFIRSQRMNMGTEPGTLILFAVLLIIGFQLLLGFINHDVQSSPNRAISRDLKLLQNRPTNKE